MEPLHRDFNTHPPEDLSLPSDLGYVKAVSVTTFRVTEEGLRHYRGTGYEEIV